jgi:predicted Zn-dependent protease
MAEIIQQLVTQAEQLFAEKKYDEIIELLNDKILEEQQSVILYAWRARAYDRKKQNDLA